MAAVYIKSCAHALIERGAFVFAGFTSGYILGWMVTDNEKVHQFNKYRPIPIAATPHNYYVYARNEEEYATCMKELGGKGLLR
jgi:hypothetical protein